MSRPAEPPRSEAMDDLPSRIIDAALETVAESGLRKLSVDDIARRAGTHRVTVYRHFKNKDELMVAAAITWAQRFFTDITAAVSDIDGVTERLVEGFTLSWMRIRQDPIVARGLANEADIFLPLLTVSGGPVIAGARAFFVEQLKAGPDSAPKIRGDDLEGAAEVAARIGLSLLLTPESRFDLDTPDRVRDFARRYIAPLIVR